MSKVKPDHLDLPPPYSFVTVQTKVINEKSKFTKKKKIIIFTFASFLLLCIYYLISSCMNSLNESEQAKLTKIRSLNEEIDNLREQIKRHEIEFDQKIYVEMIKNESKFKKMVDMKVTNLLELMNNGKFELKKSLSDEFLSKLNDELEKSTNIYREEMSKLKDEITENKSNLKELIENKVASLIDSIGNERVKDLNEYRKEIENLENKINEKESELSKIIDNKVTDLTDSIRIEKGQTIDLYQKEIINLKQELQKKITDSRDKDVNEYWKEIKNLENKINQKASKLSKIIDNKITDLTDSIRIEKDDTIKLHQKEMNNLKEEFQKKITEVNIDRSEATIPVELSEINSFLVNNWDQTKRSNFFNVRSIIWYVELKMVDYNGSKKIRIELKAISPLKNFGFSMNLAYQFKLLNHYGKRNLILPLFHSTISKESNTAIPSYITINDLGKSGFIHDDKIKLEVYIKID